MRLSGVETLEEAPIWNKSGSDEEDAMEKEDLEGVVVVVDVVFVVVGNVVVGNSRSVIIGATVVVFAVIVKIVSV